MLLCFAQQWNVLKTTGSYFFALISKGDQELARMVGCTGRPKNYPEKSSY
jgi:hypothetical protein